MIIETLRISIGYIWEHTQIQFADNLKCDGYADRQHTNNSAGMI